MFDLLAVLFSVADREGIGESAGPLDMYQTNKDHMTCTGSPSNKLPPRHRALLPNKPKPRTYCCSSLQIPVFVMNIAHLVSEAHWAQGKQTDPLTLSLIHMHTHQQVPIAFLQKGTDSRTLAWLYRNFS